MAFAKPCPNRFSSAAGVTPQSRPAHQGCESGQKASGLNQGQGPYAACNAVGKFDFRSHRYKRMELNTSILLTTAQRTCSNALKPCPLQRISSISPLGPRPVKHRRAACCEPNWRSRRPRYAGAGAPRPPSHHSQPGQQQRPGLGLGHRGRRTFRADWCADARFFLG